MLSNELKAFQDQLIEICSKRDELEHFIPEISSIPTPYPAVIVAGKFGVGKTMLLNSLLKTDLLPTSTMPMRKFYLRVGYSAMKSNALISYSDQRDELQILTKDTLDKVINDDDGNSIVAVDVWGKFDLLETGLEILESPGLGEINPEHQKVTDLLLKQAQILILLIDVSSELVPAESSLVGNIPENIKHVLIVLNDHSPDAPPKSHLSELISTAIWSVEKTISYVPHTFISLIKVASLPKEEQVTNKIMWGVDGIVSKIENLANSADLDRAEYFRRFHNIAERMLSNVRSLNSTPSEKGLTQVRSDQLEKALQLIRIINDQRDDLCKTLTDGFDAQVFTFKKGITSSSPIENFIQTRSENVDRKLNEHLLYWVGNQTFFLEEQLQRLYDKISREIAKATNIDLMNRRVDLVQIGDLISELKFRTNERQFKSKLLVGILRILEVKTNALHELVKNSLVPYKINEESVQDGVLSLLSIETQIEGVLNRLGPAKVDEILGRDQ